MSGDIRDRLLAARLPAMPQVLLKLLALCRSDSAAIGEYAELVGKDAGMAGRILGVANSAAYQRSSQRIGLEQSLMVLGVDTIKSLVIGESVAQVFNAFTRRCATDLSDFWRHSLTTAVMARELASRLSYAHAEEAYLAGLLHDVGRLALLGTAPKEYAPHFLAVDDDSLCEAEKSSLQITHAEAGAWMIERWRLDSFLADSILYHHEPARQLEAAHPLVRIVLLANRLSVGGPDSPAVAEACTVCGVSPRELQAINDNAASQVKLAAEQLGIELADPAPQEADCHAQLAEEVRQLVLTSEATRSLARQRGDLQLLEALTRSARLLFDLDDALVLLVSHGNRSLVGVPLGKHRQRLAEFSLPLVAGQRMAEAVLKKTPAFINRRTLPVSVAEDQLMRVLGTDAAVCLPLATAQQTVGALVGAVQPWQLEGLQQKSGFLQAFAAQGAAAMIAALQERTEASQRVSSVVEDYRGAAQRIVHEVNNPLSIIKNYLSVLDTKLSREEPVSGEVSILNEEIDRVSRIVKSFAQIKPESMAGVLDANRIVRDVVRLFQETEFVPPDIRINAHLHDEAMTVAGDANAVRQMLINLIKNAVEALPQGGEIHVGVQGLANRGGQLYVELNVRDNGPGIPREMLANLFTEVKSGKGGDHQGLGLCIVGELAGKLGGEVTCRSGREGTEFAILLPTRGPARNGEAPPPREIGKGEA